MLELVAAIDQNRGLGKNGQMAWNLKADLAHFRTLTSTPQNPTHQNLVIMGRITWDSLPDKFKPLPNRLNLILTRDKTITTTNALIRHDFDTLLAELPTLKTTHAIDTIFIIGGSQLYTTALPYCTKLHLTLLHTTVPCDAFFPPYQDTFTCIKKTPSQQENALNYHFEEWIKTP